MSLSTLLLAAITLLKVKDLASIEPDLWRTAEKVNKLGE